MGACTRGKRRRLKFFNREKARRARSTPAKGQKRHWLQEEENPAELEREKKQFPEANIKKEKGLSSALGGPRG